MNDKIKKKKNKYINQIKNIIYYIKKKIKYDYLQIIINSEIGKEIKIKNSNIENIENKNYKFIKINLYKKKKKCTFICNNSKKNTLKKCINYINNTINFVSKDKYNKLSKKKNLIKKNNKKKLGIIFKDNINLKKIIKICKNIEKQSINYNKKIISDGIIFIKYINYNLIYNNNIKCIKNYISKYYILINNIYTKNKNNIEYYYKYIIKHKLSDLIKNSNYLGKKSSKYLLKKKKKKKIKTKKYNIIFNKNISSIIFNYLYKSIKANNIYNNTSFLINKLNKKILPKWINIIENPFLYKGIGSKPFDNDGFNTKKYILIKNGILKTWISNYKYSNKLNIKNTYNSGGIHNWCFKNKIKNINKKKLIKKMNNGLIIDKLLGQGVNINNGNFSKGASGFLIKNKKIKYAINEITISCNLKKFFKNIIYMSNDYNKNSKIRSGSILIKNIQISGK